MRALKSASEPFTRHDAMTMTQSEIEEFWIRRQRFLAASGQTYYTTLSEQSSRDPRTKKIVATIDGRNA